MSKRKGGRDISESERTLWAAATRDVTQATPSDHAPRAKAPVSGADLLPQGRRTLTAHTMPPLGVQTTATGQGIDGKTDRRLRRGKMPIEARLDLHGMGQDAAHDAVLSFIERAALQNIRCVLIITGKGQHAQALSHWTDTPSGVIKARLPEWLTGPRIAPLVLKTYPAQPKDGGAGATYVYLRKCFT